MTAKRCPVCAAELSAWEGKQCLSHGLEPRDYRFMSVADVAVAVLEREGEVLKPYDIVRIAQRDHGRELYQPSVQVMISQDWRFCWAGKGLYGLYRHRLVPGPRNLQGIGSLFVLSAAGPIALDRLAFAMRWCGYGFEDFSLLAALRNNAPVSVRLAGADTTDARGWMIGPTDRLKEHVRLQRFAPNPRGLDETIERCRDFIAQADAERIRRLDADTSGEDRDEPSDDASPRALSSAAVAPAPRWRKSYAPCGDLTRENYDATLSAARADGRPWLDGSRKPIADILRKRGVAWSSKEERDALIRDAQRQIFAERWDRREGGVTNGD